MRRKLACLTALLAGCSAAPAPSEANGANALESSAGTVCAVATNVGECGKPVTVRTDGTQCPGLSAPATNTCNVKSGETSILSCATVMTWHPELAGHVNSRTGTVDTGWFATLSECCMNGAFGPGAVWGEVKSCCQVRDGKSPAFCETPCGTGGGLGCATCPGTLVSGGVGGSCTIETGSYQESNCQGDDGDQFYETMTIQSLGATCRTEDEQ
jgi:hypothetical protein